MERMYTVVVSAVASPAAAFDLFEFTAGTNKPIQLRRLIITQTSEPTTEEEQIRVSVIRGYTTSGSGGSAPTPVPLDGNDAAAGFTAETMNTTVASTGTALTAVEVAFNSRAGLDLPFAPDEGPRCLASERMVVRVAAPADAITFVATAHVAELL